MALTYAFGGDTGETPESIKRRRALAEAMLSRANGRAPQNMGEGINAIGQALAGRILANRADKAEAAGQRTAGAAFDEAMSGLSSGPTASGPLYNSPSSSAPSFNVTNTDGIAGGIAETASALGIDPLDLATAISYETAGTFDPTKAGPTTQWGQHRGLIQFGEPQAQKYGVDWNDPLGSQLGANGAVANYLRDTGVKPGMGMMDIYSAINAGGVGRYNASDANNGGAPGTVADKVRNQMAGHREKAMALLGAQPVGGAVNAVNQMAEPVQVASADNSFMPEATQGPSEMVMQALMGNPNPQPRSAPQQPAMVAQQQPQPQQAPQRFDGFGFDGPVTAPVDKLPAFPAPPGQQAAQAGGGSPFSPAVIKALSNPYLSDGQRQVLGAMIEMQMKANAPMSATDRLAQQRFDWERQQAANELTSVSPGTVLFDPQTRQPVYSAPTKPSDMRAPSLTSIYDDQGREQKGYMQPDGTFVPVGNSKAPSDSNGITYTDANGNTIQIGGSGKPLTEGQSKDTVYSTRAEGALPILDQFDTKLTDRGEIAKEWVPFGFGREYQESDFQLAQQASQEFLQAILRKDTGAAITPGEQALYGVTYIPQPGDGPEVIAQKKQARRRALEAIKAGLPPSAIVAQEKALQQSGSQRLPSSGQQPQEQREYSPQEVIDISRENARKAIEKSPARRDEILQKLRAANISTDGL